MKKILFIVSLWIVSTAPVWAQEKLYPVRGTIPVEKTPNEQDHFTFIVERPFEYKLTLGFPRKDQARFIRDTNASVIVLWLRVENLSKQPMKLNTERFAATDLNNHPLQRLTGDEAFDRIISGKGLTGKAVTKGLRSVTLGKAASKSAEEDARDEALRFALKSVDVPALGVQQGLIYFEGPADEKFTVNVDLGELWTKPFPFTNVKPKR